MVRDHVNQRAVKPIDRAEETAAQTGRTLGDRVEDRLKIRRRARNDAKDLRRRRLLFERFGQLTIALIEFFEEPHVLDGDYRLVGEGLQERNLTLRESSDNVASEVDRSDHSA